MTDQSLKNEKLKNIFEFQVGRTKNFFPQKCVKKWEWRWWPSRSVAAAAAAAVAATAAAAAAAATAATAAAAAAAAAAIVFRRSTIFLL